MGTMLVVIRAAIVMNMILVRQNRRVTLKEEYKIAKYKVIYELIEDNCD